MLQLYNNVWARNDSTYKKMNKKDSHFGQYKILDRIKYKIFHF